MANIQLKFTKKNSRFCLCATVVGTRIRHYKVIPTLKNPNLNKWDSRSQRFVSRAKDDLYNNQVLTEIMEKYQQLLESHNFASGAELFAWQSTTEKFTGTGPTTRLASQITLKEWINQIIEEIKYPSRLKPTSTYQGYLTLLHKLELENTLLNQPVASLNDDSFVHLIGWLNTQKGKNGRGNNFIGVMKMFSATISRARKARLTNYNPDFPYMDYAPITHKISDKASEVIAQGGTVNSLTTSQMEAFRNLDVSAPEICREAPMVYYYNLYRDFALLLYELKSRPIDVVKLHWDNIAYDPNTKRYTLTYIPAKKKNYGKSARHTSSALVVQYLSQEAVRLILKYKGKSKGGYVFPFALNQKKWNLDDPEQYHYHYYKANHICGKVNKFLHKAGKQIGAPFQLTLYAFRRSAITHAIIENKLPITIIAKTAGTSVAMIESHYANYLHTLAAY